MSKLLNVCEKCNSELEILMVQDYLSNLFPWVTSNKMITKGIIQPCKKC